MCIWQTRLAWKSSPSEMLSMFQIADLCQKETKTMFVMEYFEKLISTIN